MKHVSNKEEFEALASEYYEIIRKALADNDTANYGALLYALMAMMASTTAIAGVPEEMVKQLWDETFPTMLEKYVSARQEFHQPKGELN